MAKKKDKKEKEQKKESKKESKKKCTAKSACKKKDDEKKNKKKDKGWMMTFFSLSKYFHTTAPFEDSGFQLSLTARNLPGLTLCVTALAAARELRQDS